MQLLLFVFVLNISFLSMAYGNENQASDLFEEGVSKQKISEMQEDEIFNLAHHVFAKDKQFDPMTNLLLRFDGEDQKKYLQVLRRVAKEFSDNPSVLSALGMLYLSGEQFPKDKKMAKEFCDRALAIDSAYPKAHLLLAQILLEEGKDREALKQLEFAITDLNVQDGRQFLGSVKLCAMLVKSGHQEQAIRCFEKLLQRQDAPPKSFFAALFSIQLRNNGLSEVADLYIERAKKYFAEEVQTSSSSKLVNSAQAKSYMCYAQILSVLGEQEISKQFAQKAHELDR